MSDRERLNRALLAAVLSLVVASLLVTPCPAAALGRGIHQCISNSAANFWSFPRMTADGGIRQAILDGAANEDEVDHIWEHGCVGELCYETCTHFWDPDGPLDQTPVYDSNQATYCANAWMKANELLDDAITLYWAALDESLDPTMRGQAWYYAWEFLGHITHLIGDMTVPSHVHLDIHPTNDTFDDMYAGTDGVYSTYCVEFGDQKPGLPDLAEFGGLIDIPESAVEWVVNSGDPGFGLPAPANLQRLYAKLYYLMHTTAQRAGYFPSDDADGNAVDPWGWVYFGPAAPEGCKDRGSDVHCYPRYPSSPRTAADLDDNWSWTGHVFEATNEDGDWSRITEMSFLQGMRAVATFYQAFRDAIDDVPPETNPWVDYQIPPNAEGWTRAPASVYFDAWDNHSGVYERYAQRSPDSGAVVVPEDGFLNFTNDGVHVIRYWAQDWFGNFEAEKTITLRVDQTPPTILLGVPENGGVYLTNETLTLDWTTSDATSGLLVERASLDGVAVTRGETRDLALMAGPHTFIVEAVDHAGNVATVTAEFSVWIAATAELNPDRLNVKSAGEPVSAFVEFPAPYDVAQIDPGTAGLWYHGGAAIASEFPSGLWDLDGDGLPERMLRFSKAALVALLGDGCLPSGVLFQPVDLIVQGDLQDGVHFYAVDTITVAHF